jgi:hypothetical protein
VKPCVLLRVDGRLVENEFVLVVMRKVEGKFEKNIVDYFLFFHFWLIELLQILKHKKWIKVDGGQFVGAVWFYINNRRAMVKKKSETVFFNTSLTFTSLNYRGISLVITDLCVRPHRVDVSFLRPPPPPTKKKLEFFSLHIIPNVHIWWKLLTTMAVENVFWL